MCCLSSHHHNTSLNVLPAQDDDLVQLRERREWLDALTTVKGGLSRNTKVDLRTEAKVRGLRHLPRATCRTRSRPPENPCAGLAVHFSIQQQTTIGLEPAVETAEPWSAPPYG